MKKIIFALIIQSVIINLCTAQIIDRPKGSLTKVEVHHLYGDIVLTGTNNNQIEVELINNNEVPNKFLEQTKNKDYQYKQSNSNLDLNLSENGTTLRIYPCSKQSQFADYVIRVPKYFEVKIKNDLSFFGGIKSKGKVEIKHEINIENILSNIEIETFFANINAKSISGPIVANSFHGDMKIEFDKLYQELPSSIKTFYGDIDITLPLVSNCDITLNTFKGKFKSELQFNDVNTDYRPNYQTTYLKEGITRENNSQKINSGALKGKINKGGVEINLKTHTGNINLLEQ